MRPSRDQIFTRTTEALRSRRGDDVVDPGDRLGVAAQESVGQAGRLDEAALQLDAVARVALGLAHRDPRSAKKPPTTTTAIARTEAIVNRSTAEVTLGGSPPWRAGIALHGDLPRGSGARTAT